MLYANVNGVKRIAWPGGHATCPCCLDELIARCGEINAWHWSHLAAFDCDRWFEPESHWHLEWKRRVPASQCEVVMGPHRADIVSSTGLITELQYGSLSPEQVREREKFYGNMLWLIFAQDFAENVDLRDHDDYVSFRWKWPRQWIFTITERLILDFGEPDYWREERFFEVKKLYANIPCGGWGRMISEDQLLQDITGNRLLALSARAV